MENGQNGEHMENAIDLVVGERKSDIGNVLTQSHYMVDATALDVPINIHRAS